MTAYCETCNSPANLTRKFRYATLPAFSVDAPHSILAFVLDSYVFLHACLRLHYFTHLAKNSIFDKIVGKFEGNYR